MTITIKEKVKLNFDITAYADTIRFFIDVQWTVGEAKHATYTCQMKINSQKVEDTMFCNVVVRFKTIHEASVVLVCSG